MRHAGEHELLIIVTTLITGRQLVLKHYYDVITEQLTKIRDVAARALPLNRAFVQKLLGEGVFYACDCILGGVYGVAIAKAKSVDSLVFAKFESRVRAEEDGLRRLLESVSNKLDACTMTLVMESMRLDTVSCLK